MSTERYLNALHSSDPILTTKHDLEEMFEEIIGAVITCENGCTSCLCRTDLMEVQRNRAHARIKELNT
jgi:hypothetical protein